MLPGTAFLSLACFLVLLPQLGGQLFVDRSAVTDCHEPNRRTLAVDGIDDAKATDPELSQPFELTAERYPTFRIGCDRAHGSFDGLFQIGMERSDDLGYMRRDDGLERFHAVRRFFTDTSGSPKTSSNERPFLRVL